jgi:hypothetical protein
MAISRHSSINPRQLMWSQPYTSRCSCTCTASQSYHAHF